MIYELKKINDKVKALFAGWEETLIYSCLQQVMGKVFVTDIDNPKSACAYVGCFAFLAGAPDEKLILNKLDEFVIMTPQNEAWAELIEKCLPDAKKVIRYAIKKDTKFDKDKLKKMVGELSKGYIIKKIDGELYDECLLNPQLKDFVSAFKDKEDYMEKGRGIAIVKDGKIVSGASSYTRYNEGIEIEVDTVESERRKHLATAACAALILNCLEEGLYPSWDAQNMNSVQLAKKLGYEFSHEYIAYEVVRNDN